MSARCGRLSVYPHLTSVQRTTTSIAKPMRPEILDVYRRYWGIYDPKTLVDYRVAYALQMEVVDRAIGYFLAEIKKLGLYDSSVVAFISDHGEMNGASSHGR